MSGINTSEVTKVPETIRAVSGLAGADNRELDPKAVPFTPGQIVQQKSPSETCAREPSVKVAPEKDTNIPIGGDLIDSKDRKLMGGNTISGKGLIANESKFTNKKSKTAPR